MARAPSSSRCRSILADLIRPVAKGESEDIANSLIDRFGSLPAVLSAPRAEQRRVLADATAVVDVLRAVRCADLHIRRHPIADRPMLADTPALIEYLQAAQGYSPVEEIRVLFLNGRNVLIHEEVMWTGSVDQVPLYVREVMRRSFELSATAIVIAHNHPSGDPTPSAADVQLTRQLVDAGRDLGLTVHDHVIVAPGGHSSMRALGYMGADVEAQRPAQVRGRR